MTAMIVHSQGRRYLREANADTMEESRSIRFQKEIKKSETSNLNSPCSNSNWRVFKTPFFTAPKLLRNYPDEYES